MGMNFVNDSTKKYDLVFIGSGISTSFTILNLIDQLKDNDPSKPLKIAIIEKSSDFHGGIPYGERTTPSCLLITSLEDFLPEPELSKFIDWLNKNKDRLLDAFRKDGGALSLEWLKKHEVELANNQWKGLFIPRRFFGWYISEKVTNEVDKAQKNNLLEVDYINSVITDVVPSGEHYQVIGKNGSWLTEKVVMAIGSPPPKVISKNFAEDSNNNLMAISDLYGPGLENTLNRISGFLSRKENKSNVLIVGANASALELLYKLNDIKDIKEKIDKYYFISTLGLIPDSKVDEDKLNTYVPQNLLGLKNRPDLTAKHIADAVYSDLDESERLGIGAATTVRIVSKAFGDLLKNLSPEELENFACYYGNDIGRRQRCAGEHYTNTIKELEAQKRFEHIKGRIIDIHTKSNTEMNLEYLDTDSKKNMIHQDTFDMVVTCIGSENLESNNIPVLFKNLMSSGLCNANKSKIGFTVNQEMEASRNFHIVGPLLAGNVIEGNALWHLEHCGRIIWASKILSRKLYKYFND